MKQLEKTKMMAYGLFGCVVGLSLLLAMFLPDVQVAQANESGSGVAAAGTPNPYPPFGSDYAVSYEIPLPTESAIFYSVYNPQHNTVYAYNQTSDLFKLNLNTHTVTTLFQLPGVNNLHISQSGQYLLIWMAAGQMRLLDTTTNQIVSTYNLPSNYQQQLVVGDHMFVVTPSTIERRNALSGNVITSVGSTAVLSIAVSADQTTLYAASGFAELRKYDISNNGISLIQSATINTGLQLLTVTGDGTMLIGAIYATNFLYRYHTTDLTYIDTLTTQGVTSIGADSDYFYVLSSHSGNPQFKAYDPVTGDVTHVYQPGIAFGGALMAHPFHVLGNKQVGVYVQTDGILKFRLLLPTYYGVALPFLLHNYCFSAYTDSFANTSGGWPATTSGSIVYRYLNGEYNIYHYNTNTWGAASRGDIWIPGTRLVAIKTRLAGGDGLIGLVFGLNADWSEFYTFEILPQDQIWAVFHYTDANGWELLDADESNYILPTGKNEVAIRNQFGTTSYTQFEVNDGTVYAMGAFPSGRVGLSAGSYAANTDVRYDDYVFAMPNCPTPTGPTGISTSPATIPPHSLDGLVLDQNED